MRQYDDITLTDNIATVLDGLGIETLTPIQRRTYPIIINGQDLIGISPTGTGKSLAYVLPMIKKLSYAQGQTPRAIVVVPTRELVVQTLRFVKPFSEVNDLRWVGVFGGVGPKEQIANLANGADVVVGTPGRLWELYSEGHLIFKQVRLVVLDEADKLMMMGFLPQLHRLQEVWPRKRQNLLFSATFSDKVTQLSHDFLEWPERVQIAGDLTLPDTISQRFIYTDNEQVKHHELGELLKADANQKTIVFARRREGVQRLERLLQGSGHRHVVSIHANKGQIQRTGALGRFLELEAGVLITTEVSGRGIDVPEVDLVVNVQLPLSYREYVHRVGRTGRAGRPGLAVTFVDPGDKPWFDHLRNEHHIRGSITISSHNDRYPTTKEELIEQARSIDVYRRKYEPGYQGAFHEKKPR